MVRPVAWECPDCGHPVYGNELRQTVDAVKTHYQYGHPINPVAPINPVLELRAKRTRRRKVQAISE